MLVKCGNEHLECPILMFYATSCFRVSDPAECRGEGLPFFGVYCAVRPPALPDPDLLRGLTPLAIVQAVGGERPAGGLALRRALRVAEGLRTGAPGRR